MTIDLLVAIKIMNKPAVTVYLINNATYSQK